MLLELKIGKTKHWKGVKLTMDSVPVCWLHARKPSVTIHANEPIFTFQENGQIPLFFSEKYHVKVLPKAEVLPRWSHHRPISSTASKSWELQTK